MKQHITSDQLNELNEKGREKLLRWERKHKYDNFDDYAERVGKEPSSLGILSIGQMIEFLKGKDGLVALPVIPDCWVEADKLCDALWQAVKEVLNDLAK